MSKLLIIEDDPLILRMYEEAFNFQKHQVRTADNGEAGLALARTEKPDAIMLDIMMPKMNGLEVLKQLKQDPSLKPVPVIMLTNMSADDDVQAALKLGAVKYLTKVDLSPMEVVKEVEKIVKGSASKEPTKAG